MYNIAGAAVQQLFYPVLRMGSVPSSPPLLHRLQFPDEALDHRHAACQKAGFTASGVYCDRSKSLVMLRRPWRTLTPRAIG